MAGRSILRTGSLDSFVKYEVRISIILMFTVVPFGTYEVLFWHATPLQGDVVFVLTAELADQKLKLCSYLTDVRWFVMEQRFGMQQDKNQAFCDVNGPTQPPSSIMLVPNDCKGKAGQATIHGGVRYITLCVANANGETLPHEYLHHRRGHVGIIKNRVRYFFSEVWITAELVMRALIRTAILPIVLVLWALQKFRRSNLWRGGQHG